MLKVAQYTIIIPYLQIFLHLFWFFFIVLVFSAFYAPIQLHRSVGNSVIITTLPTRSAHLLTIFPLFSRAFAPLPTVIAGSYRKARACVSYDTGFRFLCYVASCLTIRAAISHLQSCWRAWRAERGRMAERAGAWLVQPRRQTAVCHGYWRVGIRFCYPVSAPWARLSTASGAIEPILGVLMYIKNIIIL